MFATTNNLPITEQEVAATLSDADLIRLMRLPPGTKMDEVDLPKVMKEYDDISMTPCNFLCKFAPVMIKRSAYPEQVTTVSFLSLSLFSPVACTHTHTHTHTHFLSLPYFLSPFSFFFLPSFLLLLLLLSHSLSLYPTRLFHLADAPFGLTVTTDTSPTDAQGQPHNPLSTTEDNDSLLSAAKAFTTPSSTSSMSSSVAAALPGTVSAVDVRARAQAVPAQSGRSLEGTAATSVTHAGAEDAEIYDPERDLVLKHVDDPFSRAVMTDVRRREAQATRAELQRVFTVERARLAAEADAATSKKR